MTALDSELLKILACPACKGPLEYKQAEGWLDCPACRKHYPVQDDIPILLVEEARPS